MAQHLNSLSEQQIKDMAATFTEGYRKGFILGNKPLEKKQTVNIRYCVGFERLVREEIKQFEAMGLKPTIYRAAVNSINKRMHIKIGYYGASPNKQMEFDHRFDNALYLDGDFVERKLGALKNAYESIKSLPMYTAVLLLWKYLVRSHLSQMMLKNVIILMINSRSL